MINDKYGRICFLASRIRTSCTIKICRIIFIRIFVLNTTKYEYFDILKKANTIGRILSYFQKYEIRHPYSYLRIRLNTLMYVDYIFIRKYAHI